jgi:hypothetical protein
MTKSSRRAEVLLPRWRPPLAPPLAIISREFQQLQPCLASTGCATIVWTQRPLGSPSDLGTARRSWTVRKIGHAAFRRTAPIPRPLDLGALTSYVFEGEEFANFFSLSFSRSFLRRLSRV